MNPAHGYDLAIIGDYHICRAIAFEVLGPRPEVPGEHVPGALCQEATVASASGRFLSPKIQEQIDHEPGDRALLATTRTMARQRGGTEQGERGDNAGLELAHRPISRNSVLLRRRWACSALKRCVSGALKDSRNLPKSELSCWLESRASSMKRVSMNGRA